MTVDDSLLLTIKSSGIGDEPDLGEKLIRAFFTMLVESGRLPAQCIFMSTGVFLTTEGSPVLDLLGQLEQAGSKLLSCGTCLDYYGRRDKLAIGEPTTMRDTVSAMLSFEKVISP